MELRTLQRTLPRRCSLRRNVSAHTAIIGCQCRAQSAMVWRNSFRLNRCHILDEQNEHPEAGQCLQTLPKVGSGTQCVWKSSPIEWQPNRVSQYAPKHRLNRIKLAWERFEEGVILVRTKSYSTIQCYPNERCRDNGLTMDHFQLKPVRLASTWSQRPQKIRYCSLWVTGFLRARDWFMVVFLVAARTPHLAALKQ